MGLIPTRRARGFVLLVIQRRQHAASLFLEGNQRSSVAVDCGCRTTWDQIRRSRIPGVLAGLGGRIRWPSRVSPFALLYGEIEYRQEDVDDLIGDQQAAEHRR